MKEGKFNLYDIYGNKMEVTETPSRLETAISMSERLTILTETQEDYLGLKGELSQ